MVSGIKQVPADEKAAFASQKSNNRVRAFIKDRWILCSEQVLGSSAVGFFFALKLEQELDLPVAYVVVARLGSRIEPFIPAEEHAEMGIEKEGSKIHDSAISPLASYAIKGVIWYQGESNRGSTDYFQSLEALHTGWSRVFHLPGLPFHLVQVAPFDYSRKGKPSSLLCDTVWAAQYRAAKEIPGVTVIPIHDTDINIKMIHPRRKQPVGERLAAMALKHQYGKDVTTSGPRFANAILAGNKVMVRFDGIDRGLTTRDAEPPSWFELSADGETFVPATASIEGSQVELRCETISKPKLVRMGWHDTATPNLRDRNGWPVFPFPERKVD